MPDEMFCRHNSIGGNLPGFLTSNILSHPFTSGFWNQYERPAVVNIDQPLVGGCSHYPI